MQKPIKKIFVRSSGVLKNVLVCSPENFVITKPINYTEKETFKQGIKLKKLIQEHKEFCEILKENHVKITYLPLMASCPQQTFSRDIAFVVQDTIYLANSCVEIRKKETQALRLLLENYSKVYQFEHDLEGGDIILRDNIIFVGISSRTSEKAVDELKGKLPKKFQIVPIHLRKKILHLDTVFNFVGDTAVFYEKGIKGKFDVKQYFQNVIFVSPKEQKYLPTNFLPLSKNKIIASKKNKNVNAQLGALGITVMEGTFYEMLKLGGSYRCCSQELLKN